MVNDYLLSDLLPALLHATFPRLLPGLVNGSNRGRLQEQKSEKPRYFSLLHPDSMDVFRVAELPAWLQPLPNSLAMWFLFFFFLIFFQRFLFIFGTERDRA